MMDTDLNPRQGAFARLDSPTLPAQEVDVDRLVWDREYRDEIQGRLKGDDGRLT